MGAPIVAVIEETTVFVIIELPRFPKVVRLAGYGAGPFYPRVCRHPKVLSGFPRRLKHSQQVDVCSQVLTANPCNNRLVAASHMLPAMLKQLSKEKKPPDVSTDHRGASAAAAKSPTLSEISRMVSAVARKGGKKRAAIRLEKRPKIV